MNYDVSGELNIMEVMRISQHSEKLVRVSVRIQFFNLLIFIFLYVFSFPLIFLGLADHNEHDKAE